MNRNMEKRVWQRVYGPPPTRRPPIRQLRRALNRAEENLLFYENQTGDPVYGEAFHRMAVETREHCKMLRQIMG